MLTCAEAKKIFAEKQKVKAAWSGDGKLASRNNHFSKDAAMPKKQAAKTSAKKGVSAVHARSQALKKKKPSK